MAQQSREERFILWFRETTKADVPLVGGKNASLGELMSRTSVPIPDGFSITTAAYWYFLRSAGLDTFIRETLNDLDTHNVKDLMKRGAKIRGAIEAADFPPDLEAAIIKAYRELSRRYGEKNVDVAVRSSATAEDAVDASFAGQQETYLNISGAEKVLHYAKKCMASLFTDRAISYRTDRGYDHTSAALSVTIQKMVRSDLACSGVAFSIDTETGFDKVVYITGSWGLGEYIVQGKVNPDEFYVFKPTGKLISKKLGTKDRRLTYNPSGGVVDAKVPKELRNTYILTDEEVERLASYVMEIERHYGIPQDVEWAKDGKSGQIFIVQSRPETVHATRDRRVLRTYVLKEKGELLCKGEPVGRMIGKGRAHVILDVKNITEFKKGEVLVTDMTDPSWEPIMKIASAIVTNRGGRTCHAAIVSRELGIPCVIATGNGTDVIKDGMPVTVDCSEGEGRIYKGLLDFEVRELNIENLPRTRTRIMMNVGIPEQAFDQGQIPNDGVGLARLEFIINSHIRIHPLALVNYNQLRKWLEDEEQLEELAASNNMTRKQARRKLTRTLREIDQLTQGYTDKPQYFIDQLAYGIAKIAAAFYPNPVIVRQSDFKTNEYRDLIGGWIYEPLENNPLIGWRGCSRYYSPAFLPAYRLECRALKIVRDRMGLHNVKIMFPFCRTVEEAKRCIEILREEGLERGKNGLELYCMAEIPANVVLADEFAKHFDGFSIGSNDLTCLVLGLDRDSELVAHLFDERDEAVKRSMKRLIETAHKYGVKVGICGQSPSDWPEIREFLVECGIDSMSLNPDTVIRAFLDVAETERKLGIKPDR